MIIKALLSSKPTENAKPVETTNSATVFLAPQQFGHSTQAQIYQDQQQSNFSLAKRPQTHNSALLLNNRPYRLTIDATSNIVSTPTTTFLNTNSAGLSCSRSGPLVATTTTSSSPSDHGEIYEASPSVGSSSGAGYQQKNIMIVNTSSTQFIQQTLPVKKQATTASIELHPVFIDNSKMPSQNPISIIPRYTNEKYSGPPPSYSTAISSVTNTINDKQPRVIDLTQTPAKMSMNNFNNISSTSTLSNSNGSDDNCHFMIASSAPQQKILEYSRAENGDLMITEKLVPSTSSQSMTIEHEEVVEEVHVRGSNSAESYTIKYVDFDNDMGIDVTENQFAELDKATTVEVIDHGKDITHFRPSGSSKNSSSGVKVLSDVKLTSSNIRHGMFSPTMKDITMTILKHYNDQQQTENDDEADEVSDGDENMKENSSGNSVEMSEEVISKIDTVGEVIEPIVECIESLDLSKEEDEVQRVEEQPSTSTGVRHSVGSFDDEQKPSTSGASSSGVARNNVFNPTPINRLKPSKQPKKLVVKLKKPIIETGECSSSTKGATKSEKAETECVVVKSEIEISKSPVKVESLHEKSFDTSFLDHHNYDQVNRIKITPEIHHDCETNQSLLSMDLEPETSFKKEKDDFDIVIKSEQNGSSSGVSNSQSSSSSSSEAGPSRLSHENSADNRSSPLNFLFQNERVRFSPPLSPFVYLKTFSSSQSDDNCKNEGETSWNGSNSLAIHNSDHNSTSSRYTPSIEDNRSNYTDLDSGNNKTNSSEVRHRRAPSADSLNIRTDEKMPARGEISEQESNGEIEQPWHPVSLK